MLFEVAVCFIAIVAFVFTSEVESVNMESWKYHVVIGLRQVHNVYERHFCYM
jgi:hypothetical protein